VNRDSWTGAVLVGGRSRRMGLPKALLPGRTGDPLATEALRALADAGASALLLSCAEDAPALAAEPAHTVVHDTRTDAGPLAGLEALLEACETEWLLVVACDMPDLDAGTLRTLAQRALNSNHQAVVPTSGDQVHPFHAAYHQRCLTTVRAALNAGRLRAVELTRELGAELITIEVSSLRNVNTPEDLRDAGLSFPG
jgi:molybdopterin-guanine dinucleotide biosynthesis protein A